MAGKKSDRPKLERYRSYNAKPPTDQICRGLSELRYAVLAKEIN